MVMSYQFFLFSSIVIVRQNDGLRTAIVVHYFFDCETQTLKA